MSAGTPAGSGFDLAVATLLEAQDRAELAVALCESVSRSVSAAKVILVESGAAGIAEIARCEPGHTTRAIGQHPVVTTTATDELSLGRPTGDEPITAFTVHAAQPEITLLVHRALDEGDTEICHLLIDLATTTLDRLQSEELVAEHQQRLRRLGDRLRGGGFDADSQNQDDDAGSADFAVAASLLTQREREVLEQVVAGASNAAIAEMYTLSIETVKTHVKHILRKMGASNRAELIARSV